MVCYIVVPVYRLPTMPLYNITALVCWSVISPSPYIVFPLCRSIISLPWFVGLLYRRPRISPSRNVALLCRLLSMLLCYIAVPVYCSVCRRYWILPYVDLLCRRPDLSLSRYVALLCRRPVCCSVMSPSGMLLCYVALPVCCSVMSPSRYVALLCRPPGMSLCYVEVSVYRHLGMLLCYVEVYVYSHLGMLLCYVEVYVYSHLCLLLCYVSVPIYHRSGMLLCYVAFIADHCRYFAQLSRRQRTLPSPYVALIFRHPGMFIYYVAVPSLSPSW